MPAWFESKRQQGVVQQSVGIQPSVTVTTHPRGLVDIGPKEIGILSDPNAPERGRIFVNVACKNVGQEIVSLTDCDAILVIHSGSASDLETNREVQDKYFQLFTQQHRRNPASPRSLMPGSFVWISAFGPLATGDLISAINANQLVILVAGQSRYTDGKRTWTTDLCEWMQAPLQPSSPVWHSCVIHEGERPSQNK